MSKPPVKQEVKPDFWVNAVSITMLSAFISGFTAVTIWSIRWILKMLGVI